MKAYHKSLNSLSVEYSKNNKTPTALPMKRCCRCLHIFNELGLSLLKPYFSIVAVSARRS